MGTLEQYIKEIIEIIHFFGELCETDSICFIEKRMMDSDFKYDRYKNDILKLLTNNRPKIHSQNDLKTPILKLFDKIIVFDCVDLIEKKKNFFQQALNHLEKTAGKLIIIKKLRKWTTTFDEEQSGKFNTEWTSILTDLLDAGFNIQWDVSNLLALNKNLI
ncbi:unnamed protein product [Trichobilharzia regenti]|nr:unnamed protein product [Trichobilharzia regenti]